MLSYYNQTICDSQAAVFVYANRHGFDMADFTKQFLTSDFCAQEWDQPYSWYQFADETLSMIRIQEECTLKKSSKPYFEDAIWWTGYLYREIAILYKLTSREIFKAIPFERMLASFDGYHTLSLEYAAQRLYEDFFSESEVKHG